MWWIILIIAVLLFLFIISLYNKLVTSRQKVKNAWSQIDVQLQRRFDLIPNLVETVKGYMGHEEGVLTKVTELRTSWANAKSVSEKAELDNELSGTLKTIMAVSEAYPDLKANQNFMDLQGQLAQVENDIANSRRYYNAIVRDYNTKRETFPSVLVANLFHFEKRPLFEIVEEQRENIKVEF